MKTKDRITKEEMFIKIAEIISSRSTCERLNVGSIITDSDMLNILSMGYNGNYTGGPNRCDRTEPSNCGCTHSEINSIAKADNTIKRKILFTTHSPCEACSKLIINSGFSKVFYRTDYRLLDSLNLLIKTGIEVQKI